MNNHIALNPHRLSTVTAVIAAMAVTASGLSFGQQSQQPLQLEEVIVTAQKREQRLQDVPMSLSAISSETLEDSGLTGVQDLAQMTPGLVFAETIGRQTTSPSIRGVAPFGFSDPTVAVMIDGYTSGFQRSGNNATLVDLERIEILRGPQATLYGRNAIGGVINYITRKPDDEVTGGVRAELGNYNTLVTQGSISGPLIADTFFAGLAVGYRETDGFLDNTFTGESDVNGEQDINARLTLRATPTEKLDLSLTVDYNEADDDYGDPAHIYPHIFLSANPPSLLDVGAGLVDFNNFDRNLSQDFTGWFDREESIIVFDAQYDLGWATVTSITGTSNQETSVAFGLDRTPTAAFPADVQWDVESWSQELRLTSTGDGPLNWLLGFYYFDNQRERTLFLDFGGGWFLFQNSLDEVENMALFANVEYSFSEQFSVTAGLRYDDEERKVSDLIQIDSADSSVEEWLPSLSLSYRPSDNATAYITVSRGYHAGGPNELGSIRAGAPVSYDPEYLTNYEVGIKGSLQSVPLSYEVAAFFMDWEDQQIFTAFDAFNRFIVNAGESEVRGVEAFVRYQPTESLELSASLSLLDSEYTEYFNPIDTAPYGIDPDLSGNQLIYAPELAANASVQYTLPLNSGWDLRFRGEASFVDERPFDSTNLFIADSYTITNIYLGIQNERYEAGLFVNNAFDEDYLTGGFLPSPGFAAPLATIGDPRMYGLRLRLRFANQ